ncbi:MAG: sugar transferase [Acidobacteriota bacterium]|nr:sugar transferase [Acidobacteriota bacterium]
MLRLFRSIIPAGVFPLIVSEVLIVGACFYFAAYLLIQMDPMDYFFYEGGFAPLLFAIGSILLALYFNNLYSKIRVKSRIYLLQQVCQVFGIALVTQSLLSYAHQSWVLPRGLMIYGCAAALVAIFCWRLLYNAAVLQSIEPEKLLFVGADPVVREIAREIDAAPERAYATAGYIGDPADPEIEWTGAAWLGDLPSLRKIVAERKPDRIVVGLSERRSRMPVADLLDLRYSGALIEEAGTAYERICRRICSRALQPSRLIFYRDLEPHARDLWFQGLYTRLFALALALALAPVILTIALVLMFTRGPILVRHPRVGRKGKRFFLLRFRMAGDSFGHRFHLDALPELFNVLRGEMCMVGPRAERPEFVEILSSKIPFYDYRQSVPPGMTGWAQINVPEELAAPNTMLTLEYDLYYIKHMSLSLNVYILLHALKSKLISS